MSHTASKTWVSDEAKEYEIWSRTRDAMARISPGSPFMPKTFAEWIAHRLAKKEEDRNRAEEQIGQRESEKEESPAPVQPSFGGKQFEEQHLAPVLASESIWRSSEEPLPGRAQAPWPSLEEFKHEGDDRSKSNYSRFPPLPRDPGNETVNWKQRKPLMQCPFDQVGFPTMTAAAPSAEQLGDDANEYIDECLRKSLDA